MTPDAMTVGVPAPTWNEIIRAIRSGVARAACDIDVQANINSDGELVVNAQTIDGDRWVQVFVTDDDLGNECVAASPSFDQRFRIAVGDDYGDGHPLRTMPGVVIATVVEELSDRHGTFECDACGQPAVTRSRSGGFGYSYDEGTFCGRCSS